MRPKIVFVCLLCFVLLLVSCSQPAAPTSTPAVASTTTEPKATDEPASTTSAPTQPAATAVPISDEQLAEITNDPLIAPGHPRLWLTPELVGQLRTRATAENPFYSEGLLPVAERAKEDMDAGLIMEGDCGQRAYNEYPVEAYAELFAFMSLIDPDPANRQDYATRARTLLMHALNEAVKGPVGEDDRSHRCPGDPDSPAYPPYRGPAFFTEDSDRPRWHGEAWMLTIDWIYATLTPEDKATIRTVFERWGEEIITRSYHHPEPINETYSPALLADRSQVRWAGNNYFTAHMRNLGLMALTLDPADSSPKLQGYLNNAIGAWLYLFDALTYADAQGGMLPEGFEYSPQTASYTVQFLLALKTAGQADPNLHAPFVVLDNNPFWDDFVTAYLHSLSPATTTDEEGRQAYLPAWYGDAQRYHLTDFIDTFGSLGWYDQITGNTGRLNTLRWIQTHTPPGGEAGLIDRVRRADYARQTILYFLLFDPAAAEPTPPYPSMATGYVAPGIQHLFDRTSWGAEANWLVYSLGWNEIDHQMADGNHFEFYRNGEWLTKARTGYANIAEGIASSEFRNTMAIENSRPLDLSDDDWRIDLWLRGSQWNLVSSGDPGRLLYNFTPEYTFAGGEATNLYNTEREGSTQVQHASRALVWLKPDWLIVYDRADAPAENFKRVWLQLPAPAEVNGNQATMTTANGQHLFVTALLPEGATVQMVDPSTDNVGETVATFENMTERLMTEAPAGEQARFLHIYQGADAGATPTPSELLRTDSGTAFEGVVLNGFVVLFKVNLSDEFTEMSYTAPAAAGTHLVTGLDPNAGYTAEVVSDGSVVTVTIRPGGELQSDAAGVLKIVP